MVQVIIGVVVLAHLLKTSNFRKLKSVALVE